MPIGATTIVGLGNSTGNVSFSQGRIIDAPIPPPPPPPPTLPQAAQVSFTPVSGIQGSSIMGVRLSDTTPGNVIHWNRNGGTYSIYTAGSTISVPLDQFIQAYASATGYRDSVATSYYNNSSGGGGVNPAGGGGGGLV